MSIYELAIYTWTAIVAAGLTLGLGAVLARETARAIDCVRRSCSAREPSWPSSPTPSAPSYPGI